MKMLYTVRSDDSDAEKTIINTEKERIQPQTGKLRKEVRFNISQEDANDGNLDDSTDNWAGSGVMLGGNQIGAGITGITKSVGIGNAKEDWHTRRAIELDKRRPIVLSFEKKCSLLTRAFSCTSWRSSPSKFEKRDARIITMWQRGRQKLKEDFDIIKIIKSLHDFRVLFKYYRQKHSDLMI